MPSQPGVQKRDVEVVAVVGDHHIQFRQHVHVFPQRLRLFLLVFCEDLMETVLLHIVDAAQNEFVSVRIQSGRFNVQHARAKSVEVKIPKRGAEYFLLPVFYDVLHDALSSPPASSSHASTSRSNSTT